MDFVKEQINSAVKNASSGTTSDKNKNNADPKSTTSPQQDQGQQQPDLAKTISQTMASLQAGGSGGGKGTTGGGLLPAELSSEQLSQLGRELGAGVAAERGKNPDKNTEAIGADTLKRVRDLQSHGQHGLEGVEGDAAALQGGMHQMAEKETLQEAVKQGRALLTQQEQQGKGEVEGETTTTSIPGTTNKPVTRSKAATLGGDSAGFS
ncbi:hypothetical protein PG993_001287 [Apiospora rasikravindrae]|uniref:Uncharacterized protein n=1 Tax=Apiospora rasikravindrae TaxID=990691 RepID=A0ABR1UD91_9PEZI